MRTPDLRGTTIASDDLAIFFSTVVKLKTATEIHFHNVRNMVKRDNVILKHIPTNKMMVDLLTKPIIKDVFKSHKRNLGLRRI